MSSNDIVEIRKSSILVSSYVLSLPYAYIQKQYGYPVESIIRHIHCEPRIGVGRYPNTFPNTIKEYFWIYSDLKSTWLALGILQSGFYFLYSAYSTSSNPFEGKKGNMNLWIASRYENIIKFAMSDDVYNRYLEETSPYTV